MYLCSVINHHFPCRSFWCGYTPKDDGTTSSTSHMTSTTGSYNLNSSAGGQQGAEGQQNADCEAEPTHLKLGVQIKDLTKIYSTGKKVRVSIFMPYCRHCEGTSGLLI